MPPQTPLISDRPDAMAIAPRHLYINQSLTNLAKYLNDFCTGFHDSPVSHLTKKPHFHDSLTTHLCFSFPIFNNSANFRSAHAVQIVQTDFDTNMQRIQVYISDEIYQAIEDKSKLTGNSQSKVAKELIELAYPAWLKGIDKIKPLQGYERLTMAEMLSVQANIEMLILMRKSLLNKDKSIPAEELIRSAKEEAKAELQGRWVLYK